MEMIAWFPMVMLWPIWLLARMLLWEPITVASPSPVALSIVTHSRMVM